MRVKVFALALLLALSAVFAEERYYVCVSSFLLEKNADAMVSRLSSEGLSAFKAEAQVSGQTFFRVLVGVGEEVYENAAHSRDELQGSGTFSALKINGNFWVCKAEPPVAQGSVPEPIALEANNEIPLSPEVPYSVLVRSYGEEQKAERDEERLEQQGIDAYVVKKYDEKRLFLFDLHAGAFADEGEARQLQQHIEDIGITGTQLSDYDDIKQSVDEYERRVASHTVYTDNGIEKIPAGLSDSVKECMGQFLVLPGFEVENVLVCDLDSARKNSEDSWQSEDGMSLTNETLATLNAFLLVTYEDELFGKKVGLLMGYSKDAKLKVPPASDVEGESGTKEVRLPYGTVDCTVTQNEEGVHTLTGFYGEGRFVLVLAGEGFEGEEFYELLASSGAGENLVSYPQVRKTLFVMPSSASGEREFVYYTLSKVGESYAIEKGQADWAKAIVGHWLAKSIYFYKGEHFSVSLFDLDYDYNADYNQELFMEGRVEGKGGHAQDVKGKAGWFLYNWRGTELSFAQKSYSIALNSNYGTSLVDGDFLSFASLLQIWHTPEAKTAQHTD